MLPRFALLPTMSVAVACSATDVTQTPWASSPDGEWLTRIERSDTSGPGAGFLSETIQIRNKAAEEPVNILTLDEASGPGGLVLRWRDPHNLEVTYSNGNVVFQAVKIGSVTIDTMRVSAR